MKISQEEIDAAIRAIQRAYGLDWKYSKQIESGLRAFLTVRKQRKASKRERQRKEKDKQVVESVKPAPWLKPDDFVNPYDVLFRANIGSLFPIHGGNEPSPSKAPEWDGTFGVGVWETVGGHKAIVADAEGILLKGRIKHTVNCHWYESGKFRSIGLGRAEPNTDWDLIRPWPKGEQ